MIISTQKYIESYLKIKTKESKIVPFVLNEPQKRLYETLKKQSQEGKPQRVIILKARQMGFSTLSEGIIFTRTATTHNVSSGIIAHKADATTNLFNMSKLFYDGLPEELKPASKASNAYELIFDNKQGTGLKSKIKCMTAGGEGTGRSDTYQNLHCSEVSSWNDAKETLDGLLQAVPNKPNTLVIIESTAKGYDYFKELWDAAVEGESDFVPLFCAWWELDEYRMPCPEDFELTEEEKKLIELYHLDNEQLAWRRWCIRNNCGGDENTFKQEYPACPEEAFLASGECIFNKEAIVEQIERSRQLISGERRGYFKYTKTITPITGSNGDVVAVEKHINDIEFVDYENGYITIHKEPDVKTNDEGKVIAKRRYALAGDTAGLGDDYYTAKVVGTDNLKTVATIHKQKIDEDIYADQCYCLGAYYHWALLGLETNYSYLPTKELVDCGYPNLYVRERIDKTLNEKQKVYGFETNKLTKSVIINELVAMMREDPENEVDIATLKEMLVFIRKENGSREAQDGYHDDLVMAKAIANFIAKQQGEPNWIKIEEPKQEMSKLEKMFAMDDDDDEEEIITWW